MERLKRSFSFRKKKDHVPESHKPHQWQEDERKVREGTCSFQVRYLGCIEVFESRGIQVCEEAVKALKSKNHRSVWSRMSIRRKKNKENQETPPVENIDDQCKGKYQRAILYVSGDALRVVDEISKGLIVDQTIEKVSFCAPDRNQEKGFAYICRDGTTRRWMCHGFLAVKETGERLSHAVGCAFAICLERKQKREKETVTVTFNDKGTSFTRTGSFRQTTLTERLADPQSAIIAEPVPFKPQENPNAVQRPHATVDMLQRQLSFRGFEKLGETSPFKRQLSLRMSELPSTLDRQKNFGHSLTNGTTVPTIPEASPTKEKEEASISEMCQQLTQGLSALGTDDPFASAPNSAALVAAQQQHNNTGTSNIPNSMNQSSTAPSNNPWGTPQFTSPSKVSDAEFWLHAATSIAKDSVTTQNTITTVMTNTTSSVMTTAVMNGSIQTNPSPNPLAIQQTSPWASPAPTPPVTGHPQQLPYNPVQRAPHLAQVRSHSVDTAEMWKQHQQKTPTLRELSNKGQVAQFTSQTQNTQQTQWSSMGNNTQAADSFSVDPFDAAWAAKAGGHVNPFQDGDKSVTKTFEVNL